MVKRQYIVEPPAANGHLPITVQWPISKHFLKKYITSIPKPQIYHHQSPLPWLCETLQWTGVCYQTKPENELPDIEGIPNKILHKNPSQSSQSCDSCNIGFRN